MAQAIRNVCGNCEKAIVSWSDGNPYLIDASGAKRYAYHPDPDSYLCIGNDMPHLCLACGEEFNIDSRAPVPACPKCRSTETVGTFEMEGYTCPYCKEGVFAIDPKFHAIS